MLCVRALKNLPDYLKAMTIYIIFKKSNLFKVLQARYLHILLFDDKKRIKIFSYTSYLKVVITINFFAQMQILTCGVKMFYILTC